MNCPVLAGAFGALVLIAASHALAQSATQANPKAIKAGTYKVEPYHTQVRFSVSHFGFTDFSGFFSNASGDLEIDPAHLAATKLNISVPVSTVLTTVGQLNDELKGNQWLDAGRDPNATFVSTKISQTGPESADVTGQLTLHGVTKPVTLHVRFVGAGINPLDKSNTIGFSATGVIKRSEFGVKTYVPWWETTCSCRSPARSSSPDHTNHGAPRPQHSYPHEPLLTHGYRERPWISRVSL